MSNSAEDLVEALSRAVQEAVDDIAEPIIKTAMEQVEKALRERVGGIAAQVVSQLSYERMGTDLRITVKFPS